MREAVACWGMGEMGRWRSRLLAAQRQVTQRRVRLLHTRLPACPQACTPSGPAIDTRCSSAGMAGMFLVVAECPPWTIATAMVPDAVDSGSAKDGGTSAMESVSATEWRLVRGFGPLPDAILTGETCDLCAASARCRTDRSERRGACAWRGALVARCGTSTARGVCEAATRRATRVARLPLQPCSYGRAQWRRRRVRGMALAALAWQLSIAIWATSSRSVGPRRL